MADIIFIPDGVTDNKIVAIKTIRELLSVSLKDAKEVADSVWAGNEMRCKLLPRSGVVVVEGINTLKDVCGIKAIVNDRNRKVLNEMKEAIKNCISGCMEIEEPEILEVLGIAFKMLCEK